jgi:hypothetical protein
MSQLNPFTGSILQTSQAQLTQQTERASQVRQQQATKKNSATPAQGDVFEHQVESADEVAAIHDEEKDHTKKQKNPKRHPQDEDDDADGESHLDLKA